MSPSFMMPSFLINTEMNHDKTPGRMKHKSAISPRTSQVGVPFAVITWNALMGPTRPAVPIPEPVALFSKWKTMVEIGPMMALEIIAGSHITGFFTMLGI